MNHRIRTGLLVAGAVTIATGIRGQTTGGLEQAVAYYHEHATSDYPHILEATRKFETIAAAHPEDWLPAYWTAFAYSQLALFADDERYGPYTRLAEVYYEKAWGLHTEGDSVTDADFYALKGLIMGFMSGADSTNAAQHRETARRYWDQARATDPDNPMGWMNVGLNLLPRPETRDRAYELLDRAIRLYEPRLGTTRPNWGREFIDVWTGNYPRNEQSR